MNKFFNKLTLISIILLTFSTNVFSQDNTENKTNTDTDTYTEKEATEKVKPKKQKANKALISLGNKDKYILTDSMSVFTTNAVGQYKSNPGIITIDPKEKTAGFGSSYLLTYYILQFDQDSLKTIKDAYNGYLLDFENKKLNRKNKKAYKAYGNVDVKLNWGTLKTSTPNNAKAYCNLGYDFIDGSPFFCFVIYPSYNFYSEVDDGAEKESSPLKYCFTKAQAKQLLDLLISDEVMEIFNDYDTQLYNSTSVEKDTY